MSSPTPSPRLLGRIVLATDLGAGSLELLAHGLRLALDARARLCVVHAHRGPPPSPPWDVRPVLRGLAGEWFDLPAHPDPLDRLELDLVQADSSDSSVLSGLVHTTEDLGPDLLIVGTERRQGLDRLVRASTAERLARTFQVGTLFLGEGMRALVRSDDGVLRIRRVLVPVGGTVLPQDAVDAALTFLSAIGCRDAALDLVSVGGSAEAPTLAVPAGQAHTWHAWPAGPVVPALERACRDLDADLVVMVTRGHDSFVDDIAGSKTERLMRTASCPLLAVPLLD